jgi:hypothetical protein
MPTENEKPEVPEIQRFTLKNLSDTEQEIIDTMNGNTVVGKRKYIGKNKYEGFDQKGNSLGTGTGDEIKDRVAKPYR